MVSLLVFCLRFIQIIDSYSARIHIEEMNLLACRLYIFFSLSLVNQLSEYTERERVTNNYVKYRISFPLINSLI